MKKNTNKTRKSGIQKQKRIMKQRNQANKPVKAKWPTGRNKRTTFKD
tara:strand:+ start:1532 stop:1672 length:141 start_codon:yes stop_codon:yes gene_type:complete